MDIKTVLINLVLINTFLGITLLTFSKIKKTYPGFSFWALSHLCSAVLYVFFSLRGIIPDFYSIVLANTLVIFTGFFKYFGIKKFFLKKINLKLLYLNFIFFISLMYFTYVKNSPLMRNTIISSFLIIISILITLIILKNKSKKTKAIYELAASSFIIYSLMIAFRAFSWILFPKINYLFSTQLGNSIYFNFVILLDIAWATVFFIMNNDRLSFELEEKNTKLLNLIKLKDQFLAIIAHDLKNPLSGIIGISEVSIMESKKHNIPNIENFLKLIKESAEQSSELLENLLKWAMFKSDRVRFELKNYNFSQIVEKNMFLLKHLAKLKNINFIKEYDLNLNVYCDFSMLDTVIRNLLSNALKFSNTESEIHISAKEVNNEILISIKDSGLGMTKDELFKIFNFKDKILKNGTNKEKGTGLGLILCQEYIQKHKGQLWAESEKNSGSKFNILLKNKNI